MKKTLAIYLTAALVVAACGGEDGPMGPEGPAGPEGAAGVEGPAGATGPAGDQGPTGPEGAAGADGADGADGAAGADGADGEDGRSICGDATDLVVTVDGDLSVVRGTDHILSFIVENTAGPVTDYSVTFWGPNEPTPGTNPGEWVFDTSTLGSTEYTAIITDGCKRTWYTFELDVTLPPPDVSVVGVAGANTLFAGADPVVTVTFAVTGCAVVEDVRLVLDATHEYRGDIIVELAAPTAEELLIKDSRFDDDTDDINGTFSADSTGYFLVPTMATYFDGVVGDGTWTLTLTDDWPSSDDGSFNSATLELFCQ